MNTSGKNVVRAVSAAFAVALVFMAGSVYARFGGGGGHSHFGGGHSGGGGGGGLLGFLPTPVLILVLILYFILRIYYGQKKGQNNAGNGGGERNYTPPPVSRSPFPVGLDANKVVTAFMALQEAWQRKDTKSIRKWLSDGMYQRLASQFKMMNALAQVNTLSNIQVHNIACTHVKTDGHYSVADIAITFSMNDSFTSAKYPELNEQYPGDTDTEYWTFIKRTDSHNEKNLYDNKNCPNCGAPFEAKLGEISRCNYCHTLVNSAAYDWVLCEITQADDYTGGAGLTGDANLSNLMVNDAFFATQRMEDIASNVFMQVMEALTVDDLKRLKRFADDATIEMLTKYKQSHPAFVFDRLFLNDVNLVRYGVDGAIIHLYVDMEATYRRAAIGQRLQVFDNDFVTGKFRMELTRSILAPVNTATGETVFSHECSSCGAPYTDTTDDKCSYCGAPVVDEQKNWVLTEFLWG